MALAIAVVVLAAYWDASRESASALSDFAGEQTTIARALATRLHDASEMVKLVDEARAIEEPGLRRVLVKRPGVSGLEATSGEIVRQPRIEEASDSWVWLSRDESAALGLPHRTSVVGIARAQTAEGTWSVFVLTSASRERDREIRAQWRAVIDVLLGSALVLLFGGLALRKQRKALELSRKLDIAAIERERDEKLRAADKLATLGALATGIAHEVSTPLSVISGRAEQLLPKLENDERGKRAALAILEESRRIDEVIRGFLGLARGRSPSLVHVDPEQCVNVARDLVEHRFAKAGVSLELNVDPGLRKVACEPRLFEQVLVNLLLNACEACDAGGHVELRVVSGGDRVAFVVTDDGAGITPANAARATEPFFTTKPEGTGLGLAIASEIVKHHNGTLVVSPRKHGTRVTVELPAVANI
jgi:signal transduction histidine kinase